jgi:hypothetical protein
MFDHLHPKKPRSTGFVPRRKHGPEHGIQKEIIQYLTFRGWFVKETHGNMYQSGFPDLFCTHARYGHRWVEVKDPNRTGDPFTPAQKKTFPLLCMHGSGVWVLVGANDREYDKLFRKFNWWQYTGVNK